MSVNPKVTAPVVKNAAGAPMIFFDSAPTYGQMAGVVEVELTARALIPMSNRQVTVEHITTAHLRGSLAAMASLREAIDSALRIGQQQAEAEAKIDGAVRADYPLEQRKPS